MRTHTTATVLLLALVVGACSGSEEPVPLTVPSFTTVPPETSVTAGGAAADAATEAAIRQVELGGVRGDLGFTVDDVFFNGANTCAGVLLVSEQSGQEPFPAIAYMVRTAGRRAEEIFPRAEAMNPAFLERWDAIVGDDEWGLLALFPAERDVNDVATLCSGAFLDQAERRFVALQLETVE